jgi:retron-type reverse transcriptase
VETVLFLILNPIYAVEFDKNPCLLSDSAMEYFAIKRSVHSALKCISTKCISEKWVIEGNIYKCFDNPQTIINILKKIIRDEFILNIIKSGLESKIYDMGKFWDPEVMGMRQGGKLSLLLCNILLDNLDKKIRK